MNPEHLRQTTIALEHYYDIDDVVERNDIWCRYAVKELPFATELSLFLLRDLDAPRIKDRLESVILLSRGLRNPAVARVLDLGHVDTMTYFVADPLPRLKLSDWIRAETRLAPWQVFRIVKQLASVIVDAHRLNLHYLGLTCDSVYVEDRERAMIRCMPPGIALSREELRQVQDIAMTGQVVRHIPPWEWQSKGSEVPAPEKKVIDIVKAEASDFPSADSLLSQIKDSDASVLRDRRDRLDDTHARQISEDTLYLDSDSVQTLESKDVLSENASPNPDAVSANFDADLYALAAIAYEALTGAHPFFGKNRELCDAVMSMMLATPQPLDERKDVVGIDENMSKLFKDIFANCERREGGIAQFTERFEACIGEEDRRLADASERFYARPPVPKKRIFRHAPRASSPMSKAVILGVVLFVAALSLCFLMTRHKAIDLFALPEVVPGALSGNGTDLMITARDAKGRDTESEVYIVNLRGEPSYLGKTPYILKNQKAEVKITVVLLKQGYASVQSEITVEKRPSQLVTVPMTARSK